MNCPLQLNVYCSQRIYPYILSTLSAFELFLRLIDIRLVQNQRLQQLYCALCLLKCKASGIKLSFVIVRSLLEAKAVFVMVEGLTSYLVKENYGNRCVPFTLTLYITVITIEAVLFYISYGQVMTWDG